MLLRPRALIACFLAALACEAPPVPDAGADAGQDAGRTVRDAGVDAGIDARIDAHDAGPAAGSDAGPMDPGWVRLPGLPDDCAVERAEHPELVFSIRWERCPDHPPGCLRETGSSAVIDSAWFDGSEGYLYAVMGTSERRIAVLLSTDGAAVAAWREPGYTTGDRTLCTVTLGGGDGHAVLILKHFDADRPSGDWQQIYHAPITAIGASESPLARISYPRNSPQRVAVSRQLVALSMQPGGLMVAVGLDGTVEALASAEVRGSPQRPSVVGEHIFWEDWNDLTRAAHATLGGETAFLHRADPGDVKHFRADANGLAWIEGYDRPAGGDYSRIELWTAPLAYSSAQLTPRRVTELAQRGAPAMGGGWYAMYLDRPKRIEVIRLADGTRRAWIPPPPYALAATEPLYVSEHEMLVRSGDGTHARLVRIDPHNLPLVEP